MKHSLKKSFAAVLVSAMMLFLFPAFGNMGMQKVYAGDSLANCGPNLSTAVGGGTYTLTIGVIDKTKGSIYREMYNYGDVSKYPWHSARTAIEAVSIGAGVYGIGNFAFKNMTNLQTVYIPKSMKQIGADAFSGCVNLMEVYYSGTEAQWNVLKINIASGNEYLLNATVHCGDNGPKTFDFRGPDGSKKEFANLYNVGLRNALLILENNNRITWNKDIPISNLIDLDKDGNDDLVCYFQKEPSVTRMNAASGSNLLGTTYTIRIDEDMETGGTEDIYRFSGELTFIFPPVFNGDKGSFSLDLQSGLKLSKDNYYLVASAVEKANKVDGSIDCNYAGPVTEADLDKDGSYDVVLDANGYPENLWIKKEASCSIKTETFTLKLSEAAKKYANDLDQMYYSTVVFRLNEPAVSPKTEEPAKPAADPPKETVKPETTSTTKTKKPATPGKSAVTPSQSAKLSAVVKKITAVKDDRKDIAGSTFSLLQAKGAPVKKSNTAIRISWKKIKGAKKYVIYGNKCGKGNKYKKIRTVATNSFTQKKLKKGTYYKYIVVAIDKNGKAIAASKTVHVATNGGKGKKGNATAVKLSKTSLTLKAGKSKVLKATVKYGKLKGAVHRKVAWESSNIYVAKVKAGRITAVSKGTCYVYAYAQNGKAARVKVTVK